MQLMILKQHTQPSSKDYALDQWFLTFPTTGTPIPRDIGLGTSISSSYDVSVTNISDTLSGSPLFFLEMGTPLGLQGHR